MELAAAEVAWVLIAAFVGATVRGYTGFGASLIWVASLTLVMDPDAAIPVVMLMEITVATTVFRRSRTAIAWRPVRFMFFGAVLGLPLGVTVLVLLSADTVGRIIAIAVAVSAVVIASGWRARRDPGTIATVATGFASGLMNGVTGSGGPPVILFFLGSPQGMRSGRASMSAYFGLTDIVTIGVLAAAGLVNATVMTRWLVVAPAVVLGGRLGERGFHASAVDRVRNAAIVLLLVLAVVGLLTRL